MDREDSERAQRLLRDLQNILSDDDHARRVRSGGQTIYELRELIMAATPDGD